MLRFFTSLFFVSLVASPLAAQEQASEPTPTALFPEIVSEDLVLEFHGKMDNDWSSFFGGEDIAHRSGPFEDGAELRRARLSFSGQAYEWVDFKASFDFTTTGSGLRDMWAQVSDLPVVGSFRIGHFKEPFGLENLTSSTAGTFMERSVAASLTPDRNVGFIFTDTLAHKRATWAAGIFRESNANGESQDSEFGNEVGFTGRFTYLPWYRHKGEQLVHLGLSFSQRQPNDGVLRISEGMQLHQSPTVVDTTALPSNSISLIALEVATVLGPWSLQGEWLQTRAQLSDGGAAVFPGLYVLGSYFITGESRGYSTSSGRFSLPEVASVFHPTKGGHGAWEVAARYSKLDLNSGAVFGGEIRNASLGLNWYLNPDLKAQLDFEYAELESFGSVSGLAIRIEFLW